MSKMNFRWTETNAVLDGFFELLACGKCKKTPERPVKFVMCGHMFCDTCSTENPSACMKCNMQVRPNETQPYHLVAQLISYCQTIKKAMQEINIADEQGEEAAKVTELNMRKVGKCIASMLNEEREKDSQSKTPGYRNDTQNSQSPEGNEVDWDTPGYRDPTQINSLPKEMETDSETPGFRGPTQLSKTLRESEAESDTPGYRDPTQICPSSKEDELKGKISKILAADPKTPGKRVVESMEIAEENHHVNSVTLAPETVEMQGISIRVVDAANAVIPESMETAGYDQDHDTVSVGSGLHDFVRESGTSDEESSKRTGQKSSGEADRVTEDRETDRQEFQCTLRENNQKNSEKCPAKTERGKVAKEPETVERGKLKMTDAADAKISTAETATTADVTIPAKRLTLKSSKKPEQKNLPKTVTDKIAQTKRRPGNVATKVPKMIPKNVNKRNAKGETILHTACVKGQVDYAKALLEAGANPNTKDNASWTPLQEAVTLGHREICRMLLESGASPNTPGMDNRTALHDAAMSNRLEETALLLRFNANREVYDKFGKRPIDYVSSDELRALLTDSNSVDKSATVEAPHLNATLDHSILTPNAKVVVLPSNLSTENRKLLTQLAGKLKVAVATTFRPGVTHVVVEANERNITELTYNVMLAILEGKWILNSQWISISRDLTDISDIDLEIFQVHGAPNPGTPERSRMNEEKQNPRLFNNCFFYFTIGARASWDYGKLEFTKQNLTNLVLAGRGEILNREPDPEVVEDCRLTPFHVAHKPQHALHRCSHYIIYMPGKDEPRVKYNMPHIKTLPLAWFFECIEKFALIDPILMGIS